MELGEIIKEYRERKNISLRDFEKKSGLSRSYISMLERSLIDSPTYNTISKTALGMDIDIEDLLSMLDDKQKISLLKDLTTDSVIYSSDDYTITSSTRQLKSGADPFIGPYLDSMTEPVRPSRDEMLEWLRENVRTAAYNGGNYEQLDDDKLYQLYLELKKEVDGK